MSYPTFQDGRVCHRKACDAPASPACVHLQTGDAYCPGCAKRINYSNQEMLVGHVSMEVVELTAGDFSLVEIMREVDRRIYESLGSLAIPVDLLKGGKDEL